MDRVFLDANVLFSAAYDPACRTLKLWSLPETELVISTYAAAEAYRNVAEKCARQLGRLQTLLKPLGVVDESAGGGLPPGVLLPAKDQPILLAAMSCKATRLLTGDKHFRAYYGRTIGGTLILRPGDYLKLRGA